MNFQALLASWPLEPSILVGIAATGLLYWWGLRYARAHGMARYHRWWHSLAFAGGLLTILAAIESPLDTFADQLFWAHMVQHELLVLVAAPLLLLGAPSMLFWRAVPVGARRATLRWGFRRGWPLRGLEWLAHALTTPRVAWTIFVVVFLGWHLPGLYDLALRYPVVHIMEHICFLAAALLFWAPVIPSPPLRRRMGYIAQALYLGLGTVVMNGLAALYMYSTHPLYPFYVAAEGSTQALVDQHLAGGVMDVPGTILFFSAICGLLVLWLREDERAPVEERVEPDGPRLYEGRWRTNVSTRPEASPARVP